MSGQPIIDFDHHSPELPANKEAIYADLRARCPVAKSQQHGGYWVLTSYDAVSKALRDDIVFSSFRGVPEGPFEGTIPPHRNPVRQGIIETDPPRFQKIRRAISPFFAPARVEEMEDEILRYTT